MIGKKIIGLEKCIQITVHKKKCNRNIYAFATCSKHVIAKDQVISLEEMIIIYVGNHHESADCHGLRTINSQIKRLQPL